MKFTKSIAVLALLGLMTESEVQAINITHHHKKHHHEVDFLMTQHLNHKYELLHTGDDINSDIGTLPGQTNRGYQSKLPKTYFE